jgi:regulator of protease activity HflC (stomatin/prohibitin superfamily)
MFLKRMALLAAFLLGGVLLFYQAAWAVPAGLGLIFLGALFFATFNDDEGARARWIYISVFFLLLGLLASGLLYNLQGAGRMPASYEGLLLARLIVLLLTGLTSLLLTAVFFVITVYISSYYVLSMTISEEINIWHAFRSFIALVLDTQYDWLVVGGGREIKTREGGMLSKLGGPGRIIIEPGNAVVLQKSGKITRVVGAGVVFTNRHEHIRQIFDLRNKFDSQTLNNVMTRDQIPLDVGIGIGYRILREPALTKAQIKNERAKAYSDQNADDIVVDTLGMFPVKVGTLHKAIFNNTEHSWEGLAKGAPTVQLRDHFQSYRLEQLFELLPTGDEPPHPNQRLISRIEQDILATLNGFASNNGISFTTIDIREIRLPQKMMDALMLELKSIKEAEAIRRISEQRNNAQREMIDGILRTISRFTGKPVGDVELQLATVFAQLGKRALTDDVLGHQYIEMLGELAKSDGPKVFTSPNIPLEMPVELSHAKKVN